mmetsp:Transcript_13014/g.20184  ORF Transcript_13014/g.20184 Transcript_13014/m.20184 type:complete len:117 (-) Transcript_13014:35-385(-)
MKRGTHNPGQKKWFGGGATLFKSMNYGEQSDDYMKMETVNQFKPHATSDEIADPRRRVSENHLPMVLSSSNLTRLQSPLLPNRMTQKARDEEIGFSLPGDEADVTMREHNSVDGKR